MSYPTPHPATNEPPRCHTASTTVTTLPTSPRYHVHCHGYCAASLTLMMTPLIHVVSRGLMRRLTGMLRQSAVVAVAVDAIVVGGWWRPCPTHHRLQAAGHGDLQRSTLRCSGGYGDTGVRKYGEYLDKGGTDTGREYSLFSRKVPFTPLNKP